MTLGKAAAARVLVPGSADIRLSPLRRHFVPPKVAQVPIPPKWPNDTAPRQLFANGGSGWSVPNAGVTIRICLDRRATLGSIERSVSAKTHCGVIVDGRAHG